MLKSVRYQVGPWTFIPSAHELRLGTERVRLQQRASATLSLLCECADEVVSRQQIIDRAWGRQHLSPNSVAVVIGDLRRALGIGAGEPGSIETVPKAGYRLLGNAKLAKPAVPPRRLAYVLIGIAIIGLLALAAAIVPRHSNKPQVTVGTVVNGMGTDRYASLMKACSETVLVELGRYSSEFRIFESAKPAATSDYVLQQRWVLWTGDPELVLVVRDRSGRTVWSGAIYGDQAQFPAKISDKMRQFAAFARANRARS